MNQNKNPPKNGAKAKQRIFKKGNSNELKIKLN